MEAVRALLRLALLLLGPAGRGDALAQTPCGATVRPYINGVLSGGPPNAALAATMGSCACLLDDDTGFTPLHEVANRAGANAGALVSVLVQHYGSVLETDQTGATPLHVAAARGGSVAAAALCSAAKRQGDLGSLLSARQGVDGTGGTALDAAEAGGHVQVARLLVSLGAPRSAAGNDTTSNSSDSCDPGLVNAVYLGNVTRVRVRLDARDAELAAAAALAARTGRAAAVQAAPAAACLVPPPESKRTLLHVATAAAELRAGGGADPVVRLLLERRADPASEDAAGKAPLALAASADLDQAVTALLQQSAPGAVDNTDRLGRTALHEAAISGSERAARALLALGASVDVADSEGFSALDYAEREGHDEVAQLLQMADVVRSVAASGKQLFGGETLEDLDAADTLRRVNIVGLTIGAIAGAVAAMMAAAVMWHCHRKRKQQAAEVCAIPVAEAGPEQSKLLDSLRSTARVTSLPVCDVPNQESFVPPGRVLARAGAGSDEDSGTPSAAGSSPAGSSGASKRRRGRAKLAGGDEPEPFVVVAAPQRSPTAAGAGRGGEGAQEGSSPSRRPGTIGQQQSTSEESPKSTERESSSSMSEGMVRQLRAELRKLEEKPKAPAPSAGARVVPQALQGGGGGGGPSSSAAAAAAAALGRLPTPPVDTSDDKPEGRPAPRPVSAFSAASSSLPPTPPQPPGRPLRAQRAAGRATPEAMPEVALPAALQGPPVPPPAAKTKTTLL